MQGEGKMNNNIINKVAAAIVECGYVDGDGTEQAIAAIEAMRYLVKMTPNGHQIHDIMLNEYIDKIFDIETTKND